MKFFLLMIAVLEQVIATMEEPNQLQCHELPVVIVRATKEPFPDATCNQQRYPAPNCLKREVETSVDVVDHFKFDGQKNCLRDIPTASYISKTNYRGQSSLYFAKHQMNLKFHQSVQFIDFPEDKIFILNGPYLDCTMLRNHLAHWLYRGTGRYSPSTQHVALYIQENPSLLSTPSYSGIYLVLEKLTYTKHRLGLASLTPGCTTKELNGGWAWQNDPLTYASLSPNMVVDQYQNEFGMGERPILEFPRESQLSQRMRDYFVNTSTGFLPQLFRYLWHNMTSPDGLEKHIDLGSFADYILHTEMSLNVDAYRRSTFFFKDRDQLINAGPVWDLNLAYGNGARRDFKDWIYIQYTFWKRIMCNYKLTSLVIQRWKELRQEKYGPWNDHAITSFIDSSAEPLLKQLQQCRGDWRSNVLQCALVDLQTCNGTLEYQIEQLKVAVLKRSHWMDEKITELYKKLDASTCSGVGTLPEYNCAANTSDSGCLKDPQSYYTNVTFPPIRKPYEGPPCKPLAWDNPDIQRIRREKNVSSDYFFPTVDYCWQVAIGSPYLNGGAIDKSLTKFCNGYGTCEEGPGAQCHCVKGIRLDKATCRRLDAFTMKANTTALSAITSEESLSQTLELRPPLTNAGYPMVLLVSAFVIVGILRYKRYIKRASAHAYRQDTLSTQYGTVEV